MRGWLARPQAATDVAVVVVVLALAVADLAAAGSDDSTERGADWLAYGLAGVGAVSLWWRRRAPVAVLAVVVAVLTAVYMREYGAFLSVVGLPAIYAVAAHDDHRQRAWSAMVLASVVLLVAASFSLLDTDDGFNYFALISMASFLAAAMVAGVVVRNRQRTFADTERRAAIAEADRAVEAERAASRERSRIAREMHDVLAHSMSVIAVQAAGGKEIARTDPDRAVEVFGRIEAVGRESLAELRRMLGVLRDEPAGGPALTPQPGLADIAAIVEQSTAAGVATELVVDGSPRDLAPGIELAAFRIVQEALTNVRKHAGRTARSTVRIGYRPDELLLEVVDDGRGAASGLATAGTGHGLIGMRERVEVYGGEMSCGPRAGGGYAVRVRLPAARAPGGLSEQPTFGAPGS